MTRKIRKSTMQKNQVKKKPSSKKNWPILSYAEGNSSNILRYLLAQQVLFFLFYILPFGNMFSKVDLKTLCNQMYSSLYDL